jgi:glutathione S-transferase
MTRGSYRLYGRTNAGSLAVQMVLEETGLPYEITWLSKDAADVAALRKVNPSGKIPALMLPDGTLISESAAMLIHLAGANPARALAPAAGTAQHARFLQWMVFLSANMYEALLRYFYAERYSTGGAAAASGIKVQGLADWDRHLSSVAGNLAPWVLGDELSAADCYLHMLAGWHPDLEALHARLPALARHAQLLRARPATLRAEGDHAEA